MLTIVYSIAPLVLIIIAGVLSGRTGLVSPTFRKGLSDFCFYFGMPALLVRTIATAPPSSTAAHLIWAAYLIPAGLVWIAATVLVRDEGARTREAPSIAMASAYGNVIMLGIPLALAQFGQASATTVAFIVLVHSPVLFLAAALHSELADALFAPRLQEAATLPSAGGGVAVHRGRMIGAGLMRATREVCIELATNPIIVAILVGLILRMTGVGLDPITSAALTLLGQATLPCVLLAMGLSLSAFELKGETSAIGLISFLKLAAMPTMAWLTTFHLFHLPATDAAVITLLSAMPTGANAYVFASRSGQVEASVSGAVAVSTMLSIVSVTVVLAAVGISPQ
jgi:malonate transporter and related proteins